MLAMHSDKRRIQFNNLLAREKVRLQDPATGEFLHMPGAGRVPNPENSWLGHQYQAQELATRAAALGEPWTFEPVRRETDAPGTKPVTQVTSDLPVMDSGKPGP